MSTIEHTQHILTSMIKSVLENNHYTGMSDRSIDRLASATIENTPALEIISEMEGCCGPADSTGEVEHLMREIELLAIITSMMDHHHQYLHGS
jgi:hypothetical protein